MTIRTKALLLVALALVLPFAAVALAFSLRPIQRAADLDDARLAAAAIAAGQVYEQREAHVLAAALDATNRFGASGIIDSLQPLNPVAESSPGAAAVSQLAQGAALEEFNAQAQGLLRQHAIDFLILTNAQGRVLARTGGRPGANESLRDNPLVSALIGGRTGYAARASSVMESRTMLQPLVQDRGKVNQRGGPLRIENGLVIEAAAPILTIDQLLGVVLAGQLVNQSQGSPPSVVTEAQNALRASAPPGLPGAPEVSVVFQTLAVATTAQDGLGFAVPDAIGKATATGVQALSVNNVRQVAGVYPVRNRLNNSVVAHVLVTEPRTYWRDLLKTVGWPALLAFGVSLLCTLAAIFVTTTRLGQAVRRVNDDIMRVATGDFDTQVELLEREDEVGRLAESVERLRVTVKQAIERLRRRLATPAEVEKVGD